jgi:peptidoglycan hydrolase-like protein with peptidoglycan-binding domain
MAAGRPLTSICRKLAWVAITGVLFLTGAPATSAVTASAAQANPTAVSAVSMLQRWPVLRQGPNSIWPRATVRSLQHLLRARGVLIPVSGTFGSQTRAAVVAFQRNHHLVADGVVGSQTWRSLIITVGLGSRGDAVRAVQDQINFRNLKNGHTVAVDGVFGLNTRRAVIAFQGVLALDIKPFAVDGIVGPQTWPPLVNEAYSG